MNKNLSFDMTFEANNELFEISVNASLYTEDDIRNEIRSLGLLIEPYDDFDDDFEFIVFDWGNTPDNMQDLKIIAECLENVEYYDDDIISAGIACDVSISNIDEAYAGSFNSHEDFAEDMAEQLGLINIDASWPYTHIDWEQAASELMYDYLEHNGHYFRMF